MTVFRLLHSNPVGAAGNTPQPKGSASPSAGTDDLPSVEGSAVLGAAAAGNLPTIRSNALPADSTPLGERLVLLEQRIASIEEVLAEHREAMKWRVSAIHLTFRG